jgi:hypothetical protein
LWHRAVIPLVDSGTTTIGQVVIAAQRSRVEL